MSEGNKALAERFYVDIFQAGNLAVADEILSGGFEWHGGMDPPAGRRGPGAVKQVATAVRTAFPDLQITHDDTIAEGDKVVIRWTARATHKVELMGIPPTGRPVTITGFAYFRLAGGKIVEMWQEVDRLGMMQQIGAIPSQ